MTKEAEFFLIFFIINFCEFLISDPNIFIINHIIRKNKIINLKLSIYLI